MMKYVCLVLYYFDPQQNDMLVCAVRQRFERSRAKAAASLISSSDYFQRIFSNPVSYPGLFRFDHMANTAHVNSLLQIDPYHFGRLSLPQRITKRTDSRGAALSILENELSINNIDINRIRILQIGRMNAEDTVYVYGLHLQELYEIPSLRQHIRKRSKRNPTINRYEFLSVAKLISQMKSAHTNECIHIFSETQCYTDMFFLVMEQLTQRRVNVLAKTVFHIQLHNFICNYPYQIQIDALKEAANVLHAELTENEMRHPEEPLERDETRQTILLNH